MSWQDFEANVWSTYLGWSFVGIFSSENFDRRRKSSFSTSNLDWQCERDGGVVVRGQAGHPIRQVRGVRIEGLGGVKVSLSYIVLELTSPDSVSLSMIIVLLSNPIVALVPTIQLVFGPVQHAISFSNIEIQTVRNTCTVIIQFGQCNTGIW